MFTKIIKDFELPFGGKDLFLLSQTEESKTATVHSLDHNLTLNLRSKAKSANDDHHHSCKLEVVNDIESIYTNILEADVLTNHQITYYIPSKISKANAKNFKHINESVFAQLKTQLNSCVFQIAKKHLIKPSDESKTFKELLKSHHFNAVNEVHKIDIEAYLPKIHSVIHPEHNTASAEKSKGSLSFSGCIHSKIYVHLDWTMHEFTKYLTEDIHRSLLARIELMSEEAHNSECNIDPCLITEENIPRLTDIHLIYPQRVY